MKKSKYIDNKMKKINSELKNFRKKKIPRCIICKTPMKNAYDSIEKKISPYLWETDCKHQKGMRLAIG